MENTNKGGTEAEEVVETEETKTDKEEESGDKTLDETEGERKKTSELSFIVSITLIVVILVILLIGFRYFRKEEQPKTIDELHSLNLEGELEPEQGYIYNGYSFVLANGLWYTQVQTPSGKSLFNIPLHYSPKLVEDIPVEGELNLTLFNSNRGIYITFDPLGQSLNYVALAVGEFDQNIIKSFNKVPIAACDKNETDACSRVPIITCNKTEMPVLYLEQKPEAKVIYKGNCIIVQGIGPDIVRAIDRLLLRLYGIMP